MKLIIMKKRSNKISILKSSHKIAFESCPQHSPYHYAFNSPLIWKVDLRKYFEIEIRLKFNIQNNFQTG